MARQQLLSSGLLIEVRRRFCSMVARGALRR